MPFCHRGEKEGNSERPVRFCDALSCCGSAILLLAFLEEKRFLLLFFSDIALYEDFFTCSGVTTGVVHLGRDGHGCRRKNLHLLGPYAAEGRMPREGLHILQGTTRVSSDEIRDDLVFQAPGANQFVELEFQPLEELEGGLAHGVEHMIFRMLRRNLQATAGVLRNQFFEIAAARRVEEAVLIEEKVVADATADKHVLDTWHA